MLPDTIWVKDKYGVEKEKLVEDQLYRGLGVNPTDLSVKEQLEGLKLNWKPQTSPIRYGSLFQYMSESAQALYRPDNGQFMGTVSADWYSENQSFQSILSTFNKFCTDSSLKLERVGAIEQYAKTNGIFGDSTQLNLKLWAVADLNEQFDLPGDDTIYGKLLLVCPYIYGQGYTVKLQGYRKVCSNGMHRSVKAGQKIISHVGKATLGNIELVLAGAKTCWQELQQTSELLANTPLTQKEAIAMLIAKFGDSTKPINEQPKVVQTCIEMFTNGSFIGGDMLSAYNTAWGLLQCVTEYYNHRSVSQNPNTQLNSLWMGHKCQQQVSFLESISSLAHERDNRDKTPQTVAVAAW